LNIEKGSELIMKKEILISYGVHVDAVAGWLGSYGGENSPCDISRGVFAAKVGVPRLLKMFKKYDIKTSWYITGHSIETFPDEMKQVAEAGHEIGLHGYSHENPLFMTPEQEEAVLVKCIDLITELCGKKPSGYVAPWWESSAVTAELLLKYGIKYDHSLMNDDFTPYYTTVGDSWTKIDYSKPAQEWMKPMKFGTTTDLVQIPANWYLDDLPPMMFVKASPNSYGYTNPHDVEQMWREQFDYLYREYDYGVYPITIHPDASGRPHCLLMHERLIEYFKSFPGVKFVTVDEMAEDFRTRFPR
jgi:peptidoglycan/xylan/chitin deacetylase (PgdA/CDA1 family)